MSRNQIPQCTQADILRRSRRRCALCFVYNFDTEIKQGQIAHIDRNPANNDPENLVFLCLIHHDEYDTRTSLSKGIKAEELTLARRDLDDFINKSLLRLVPEVENIPDDNHESRSEAKPTVSVDIYQARIPIYNAYRTLLGKIMRDASVEMVDLFTFLNDTHEALFLYGEEIANFVEEVYKHGIQLWFSQKQMEHPDRHSEDAWGKIVDKNEQLILWFSNGFSDARKMFLAYLRLR